MSLSPDELVDYLLESLAYNGDEGASMDELWGFAIEKVHSLDDFQKETIWRWLLAEEDHFVVAVDGNALDNDELSIGLADLTKKYGDNLQAYASAQDQWLLLTGQKKEDNSLGPYPFQLLCAITRKRSKGINAIELARETGQDPRSLNGRVGKLVEHGLIQKRPIVFKGQNTSHLTYTKFDPSSERAAYGEIGIDMRELSRSIVNATRIAKNGLRQHDDLKLELGFDKTKRAHIIFSRQIRRLEDMGCVKRVWVTRSGTNDRFRCVKYIQDIPEDGESDDSGEEDNDVFDEFKHADDDANQGLSQQPPDTLNPDDVEASTVGDPSLSERSSSQRTILFNTVYPLECQFYSMVAEGGEQGLRAMDMLKYLCGRGYNRIMSRTLDFVIDKSPQKNGQPTHLGHYDVVKGIDTIGRVKFFRYFTRIGFSKFSGTALKPEWGKFPADSRKTAMQTLMALHKKFSTAIPGQVDVSKGSNGATVIHFNRERPLLASKSPSKPKVPAKRRGRPPKNPKTTTIPNPAGKSNLLMTTTGTAATAPAPATATMDPVPDASVSIAVNAATKDNSVGEDEVVIVKKKRGRPPKKQSDKLIKTTADSSTPIVKRKRGRPRKYNTSNVLLTPDVAKSLLDSLVDSPMRAAAEPRLLNLHSQVSSQSPRLTSLSAGKQSTSSSSSGNGPAGKPRRLVQSSLVSSLSPASTTELSASNFQQSSSVNLTRSDSAGENAEDNSVSSPPPEPAGVSPVPKLATVRVDSAPQSASTPAQGGLAQTPPASSSSAVHSITTAHSSPATPVQMAHPGYPVPGHPYPPHAMGRGFHPQMAHGSPPPPPFVAVPPHGYPVQPIMSPYGSPQPQPQYGHPMGHHMHYPMPMYMGMPQPLPPHSAGMPMMAGQPPMGYNPGIPPPGYGPAPPPNAVPWGGMPQHSPHGQPANTAPWGGPPLHNSPSSQHVQRMDVDLTGDSEDVVVERVVESPVSKEVERANTVDAMTVEAENKTHAIVKEEEQRPELGSTNTSLAMSEREASPAPEMNADLPEVEDEPEKSEGSMEGFAQSDVKSNGKSDSTNVEIEISEEANLANLAADDEQPSSEEIITEPTIEPENVEERQEVDPATDGIAAEEEQTGNETSALLEADEADMAKTPQPSSPLDKSLEVDATVITTATPQPEVPTKRLKPKLAPPPLTPRVSQTPEVSTPSNMGVLSVRVSPDVSSQSKNPTEASSSSSEGKSSNGAPMTSRNGSGERTAERPYEKIDWTKGKYGEPVFSMEPPEGHLAAKAGNSKSGVDLSFASIRREKVILDLLKESEGIMEGGVVLSRRISAMTKRDERMDRKTIDKTIRNMVLKGDVRQLFITVPRVNGIHITKYLILDKGVDVNSKEVNDAKVAITESLRSKKHIELGSRNYDVEKAEFEYYTSARDGHFWSPTSKRIAYGATRYQDPSKRLRTIANQVKARKPRGLLSAAIQNAMSEEARAEAIAAKEAAKRAAKEAAAAKAKEKRRAAREAVKAAKAAKATEKAKYRKYYGPEEGQVQRTDKPREPKRRKKKALPNNDPLYPITDGLRKRMFNRRKARQEGSMPKESVKRRVRPPSFRAKEVDADTIFRIVVIIRSLYHRNRAINWEKVLDELPEAYTVDFAKLQWTKARDAFGGRLRMEQAMRRWETLFLKGYENGDLPIVHSEDDFDIPLYLRYWRKNERVLETTIELLATKEDTLKEYDFYVTDRNEGLESMHNATSMTQKDEAMTNVSLGYRSKEESNEATKLSRAKQAIKAIIATDNTEYDAELSKRILDNLGEQLCVDAVKSLEQDRAIMCVAKERQNFIPGRNFMFSDRFYQALHTKYSDSILEEATKFEESLVSALNSKKGLIMSRTASDSSIVSILDFIAFNLVDVVRVNGASVLLKDSYRTRTLDKEKLDFDIVIKSKDSSTMDLVARPDVPVPLSSEACGNIWTSMVGTVSKTIWGHIVKSTLWDIALHPGITVEVVNARMHNITTYQEAEMVIKWLVAKGAVEEIGDNGYMVTPRWYSSII